MTRSKKKEWPWLSARRLAVIKEHRARTAALSREVDDLKKTCAALQGERDALLSGRVVATSAVTELIRALR